MIWSTIKTFLIGVSRIGDKVKTFNFEEKNLYNGAQHHAGTRVVPFVIESLKVAVELGVKPQYMETHHLPNGKPYPVAFTEVPEAEFETYMSITHAEDIRDYFDRYGEVSYKEQFARCTINGNVCPLYKHCSSCKEVDDQGRLRRDMKQGLMSLDKVVEDGHDPTGCGTDTVDTLLSDLLEASSKIKEDYPIIIRKVYEGYKPSEFIDELPVKKSQAYQDVKDALNFVKEFLKK